MGMAVEQRIGPKHSSTFSPMVRFLVRARTIRAFGGSATVTNPRTYRKAVLACHRTVATATVTHRLLPMQIQVSTNIPTTLSALIVRTHFSSPLIAHLRLFTTGLTWKYSVTPNWSCQAVRRSLAFSNLCPSIVQPPVVGCPTESS